MSILINRETRVVVQGITGKAGLFHTRMCREYGTKVVAGVTPGKGGGHIDGIPVFDTMEEAVAITGADLSLIFVPPSGAADAILEASEARIDVAICITEGVPIRDMVMAKRVLNASRTRLIGPNCPGVITPGACKAGIMPGYIHRPGRIGVVSRSGTLTYEAVKQLTDVGLGQSTVVGIGGDPIIGMKFTDVLELFNADPDTEGVLLIGEIGGTVEEDAALWIRDKMNKPVAAFIAGATAPPGRRMGHAGAIITGEQGRAEGKIAALRASGVTVAESPTHMATAMLEALQGSSENKSSFI